MNIAKKVVTNTTIEFLWADETSTLITFGDYDQAIRDRAMSHGFSQKLGDSYSGAKSVSEAKEMLDSVHQALREDDWNRKGGLSGGIVVEAMAKASGDTFENALKSWLNLDEDGQKAMRKEPSVKKARLEIELAKANKKAADLPKFTL